MENYVHGFQCSEKVGGGGGGGGGRFVLAILMITD